MLSAALAAGGARWHVGTGDPLSWSSGPAKVFTFAFTARIRV